MAMEKRRNLVYLSVLAATSMVLVEAAPALPGSAAKESSGQSTSRDARRTALPVPRLNGDTLGPATPSTRKFEADISHAPTAGDFVNAVVANELSDREKQRKWLCLIEKRTGKQTLTEVQIETKDGPLFRLLAIDGTTLSPGQRQQDDERLRRLLKDPKTLLKLKQAEEEDEAKLEKIISLLPEAFVYEYDGAEGQLLRVKFRPNVNYVPPTYEARVIHSLAGTILIDAEEKRLAKVSGQLVNRVEFGYGLLGKVDSGTVELGRVPVGPQEWKTAFINIHFSGRLAIFKTISKDQYERRSDFRAVSSELSLSDAKELLISRGLPSAQASENRERFKTP
jgi:hypothetical protein